MELANIQSRLLKMMAASQRSQQEAFQELTRASKDKSNDAMFDSIKVFNGKNRQAFEDWIDRLNISPMIGRVVLLMIGCLLFTNCWVVYGTGGYRL